MVNSYNFLKKYGVIIGFSTGAVIALLTYVFILAGYPDIEPTKEELYDYGVFDFGLYATYFLVFVAVVISVVFSVLNVVKNPASAKKVLIGLIGVGALIIVTQIMGDGTLTLEMVKSDESLLPQGEIFQDGVSSSSAVKFADGLIKMTYVLIVAAILSTLGGIIYGFTKQQ